MAGQGAAALTRRVVCSRELSGAVTALMQGGGAGGFKADIVDKKNNEFLRCHARDCGTHTPHLCDACMPRTLVNLLQDADEASLPAILNCMHFLCDNDPAAQVRTLLPPPPPAPSSRTHVMLAVQALLSRFGAPRLLAAHLLRSGMQVSMKRIVDCSSR